jgi:hypothetical protein
MKPRSLSPHIPRHLFMWGIRVAVVVRVPYTVHLHHKLRWHTRLLLPWFLACSWCAFIITHHSVCVLSRRKISPNETAHEYQYICMREFKHYDMIRVSQWGIWIHLQILQGMHMLYCRCVARVVHSVCVCMWGVIVCVCVHLWNASKHDIFWLHLQWLVHIVRQKRRRWTTIQSREVLNEIVLRTSSHPQNIVS